MITLPTTQVSQQQKNWCGPATAYMILKTMGKTKSAFRPSDVFNQATLSGNDYTQAGTPTGTFDANGNEIYRNGTGGTDFQDGDMERALNRWEGGTWGWSRLNGDPAHPDFLWDWAFINLNNGHPMAADMVETFNGAHYNGHPNRAKAIFHWTVIYGMFGYETTNFGKLRFADPASGAATLGWANVQRYFTLTTRAAMNQMAHDGWVRGVVW